MEGMSDMAKKPKHGSKETISIGDRRGSKITNEHVLDSNTWMFVISWSFTEGTTAWRSQYGY